MYCVILSSRQKKLLTSSTCNVSNSRIISAKFPRAVTSDWGSFTSIASSIFSTRAAKDAKCSSRELEPKDAGCCCCCCGEVWLDMVWWLWYCDDCQQGQGLMIDVKKSKQKNKKDWRNKNKASSRLSIKGKWNDIPSPSQTLIIYFMDRWWRPVENVTSWTIVSLKKSIRNTFTPIITLLNLFSLCSLGGKYSHIFTAPKMKQLKPKFTCKTDWSAALSHLLLVLFFFCCVGFTGTKKPHTHNSWPLRLCGIIICKKTKANNKNKTEAAKKHLTPKVSFINIYHILILREVYFVCIHSVTTSHGFLLITKYQPPHIEKFWFRK